MKRRWFSAGLLVLLFILALWSSSLIIGEPAEHPNATERWETPQALLHEAETRWAYLNQLTIGFGVFKAYFLDVPDGVSAEMNVLKENLGSRYRWSVADISLDAFANGEVDFRNPDTIGEVLIIAGGSTPLSDAELTALQDYVGSGGDLVIFAGTNLNDGMISLATARNLNDWLDRDFGLRFNNDIVIDNTQAFQSPLIPVSTRFNVSSFITTNGIPVEGSAAVFEVPNSIRISASPRANVNVDALLRSTFNAYSKSDLANVLNNDLDQENGDRSGSYILAASIENEQTGSRIVLFGSTSLGVDDYSAFQSIDNLSVAFNSFVWATHFDEYFDQVMDRQATATAQASGN